MAFCTFLLIIAGGLVTSTDSGLAVPDWPLSYGQVMPPMVGGIFYEHGHRMIATFVGVLTTILAFWFWRKEERSWVRNLAWIALLAVIIQGLLGGLTVIFLLPTVISVAHATLAQSFFCLIVFLSVVTSPSWQEERVDHSTDNSRTRRLTVLTTCAIFVQLILGALMRHSHSGMAIPDFPLSYGGVLPPFDAGGLPAINQERMWDNLGPVTLGQIWIHYAHRVGAVLVAGVAAVNLRHVLRTFPTRPWLREPALILFLLVLVQVLLGALTVWNGKTVQVATAHVVTGALLLATSVVLTARVFQSCRVPREIVLQELAVEGGRV